MSELQGRTTEELAYLLWEKQGRPENRSAGNWVESEYLAHPRAISQQPIDSGEIDLRMRGLGPLTLNGTAPEPQSDCAERGESHGPSTTMIASPVAVATVAGTALVVVVGEILSLFRKQTW